MDFRTAMALARAGHVIVARNGEYEDHGEQEHDACTCKEPARPVHVCKGYGGRTVKAVSTCRCPNPDHPVQTCPDPHTVLFATEPGWTMPAWVPSKSRTTRTRSRTVQGEPVDQGGTLL